MTTLSSLTYIGFRLDEIATITVAALAYNIMDPYGVQSALSAVGKLVNTLPHGPLPFKNHSIVCVLLGFPILSLSIAIGTEAILALGAHFASTRITLRILSPSS